MLFRWIKQHLKIRNFLGRNDNAIRLHILAQIDKPPDVHPAKAKPRYSPDQFEFCYA